MDLKGIRKLAGLKIAAVIFSIAMTGSSALGQCGMSLNAMFAAASLVKDRPMFKTQTDVKASKSDTPESTGFAAENVVNPSIVGMWHIRFVIGDTTIQEAYQIWNQGGTEVHNPNVDPRTNNICLGTWIQAPTQIFKLNHRVWFYDTNGNFQGVGFLTESLTLSNGGQTQSGTFNLEIHDPNGNVVASVPGNVVGERITVN
jgi:hypothetical protein